MYAKPRFQLKFIKYINKEAYTLIELSIVLTIIAILTTTGIGIYKNYDTANDHLENQKILRKIEEALIVYFNENKRLPCPALISDPSTNANYTSENAVNTNCNELPLPIDVCNSNMQVDVNIDIIPITNCTNAGNNISFCNSFTNDGTLSYYTGAIPVKTIGLDDSLIYDRWGSKITYKVPKYLACSNSGNIAKVFYNYDDTVTKQYGIKVDNHHIAQTPENKNITHYASYALISHGQNKMGAYNKNGTKYSSSTDQNEVINEADASGAYAIYKRLKLPKNTTSAEKYDDYVRFKTRAQMVFEAKIINQEGYQARFVDNECFCDDNNVLNDIKQVARWLCLGSN